MASLFFAHKTWPKMKGETIMNENIYEAIVDLVTLGVAFAGGVLLGVGITRERQAREEESEERADMND